MLDRTDNVIKTRVTELVHRLLAKRNPPRPAGDNDDLGDSGLSSLDFVNLMLGVETEFDIRIPEHDMSPSNFRSIACIDALVTKVLDQDRCG